MDTLAKTADDIADLIAERKALAERRATESFRAKCFNAVSKMIIDMDYETVVEVLDEDLLALKAVTEEMRTLNYKFRFIEIQNEKGEILNHKLAISIDHVK